MFKVWIAKEANFEAEKEKNQLLLKIAELEQAKETVEQERDKITDMETQRKYHLDKDADRRKAQDRIKELEKKIANIEDTKSREVTNIRMDLEGKCRSLANLQKVLDETKQELMVKAQDSDNFMNGLTDASSLLGGLKVDLAEARDNIETLETELELRREKTDELLRELDQAAEDKKAMMVKIGQLETEKVELQAVIASQNNVAETTKCEEMEMKFDAASYELNKFRNRNEKLETLLVETQSELSVYMQANGGKEIKSAPTVLSGTERKSLDELQRDLEDQRELSANRLGELEKLQGNYKECLQEVEKLRMELRTLPEYVVVETTEHKSLQSQFSVLYNEAMQLKTQLEEKRAQLGVAKNAHMRQIEQMEAEELLAQKKLRNEAIQLEDVLAQVRKEYEMLRIEFDQNLVANEQTGPINKEMRNLITSLQTHNNQLKGEVARYKRKFKEKEVEITKLRKENNELKEAEIKALQAKKEALMSAVEGAGAINEEGIKEESKEGILDTNQKQEEETLLSDIEVTGQAFEDMQEQNGRLVQQLREKDNANFKLMSERIKSNQIARLAREEKTEALSDHKLDVKLSCWIKDLEDILSNIK